MANYESVLDMPAQDIVPPKALPVGEYIFIVTGPHKAKDVKGSDGSLVTVAEFQCRPTMPQGSVDQAALAEFGWPTEKTQKMSFWLTSDDMYRLQEFVRDTLGLDVEGKTPRMLLSMIPGNQFIGTVKQKPSADGKRMFSEINGTAKL